jgi:signal transduction histidine kinase
MSTRASLRRRLVIGVVCFTTVITVATSLIGLWFDEQAEQRVWEAMFTSAAAHHAAASHAESSTADQPFLTFGANAGKPVPAAFANLGPGIHDDVALGDRTYVIDVRGSANAPAVLALDITDMERGESTLDHEMILSAIFIVLMLIALTYMAAQWLIKPLAKLSKGIGHLQPNTREQQLDIQPADPAEVVVIAEAVNTYLRDIDGYVAREHKFLTMASHELRTPLAVISGAAEVANEQPTIEAARAHISRIVDASHTMHDLVELLLALARDPERLRANAVPMNLAALVRHVVADHEHLLAGKELTVTCNDMPGAELALPRTIAESVIGNLVRNAIENGNRGVIAISADDSETLVISGPGSTMSPQERSRLQSRLARAGMGQGDGIGLELVERLCHHMGWSLDLQLATNGGTTARLRMSPLLAVRGAI